MIPIVRPLFIPCNTIVFRFTKLPIYYNYATSLLTGPNRLFTTKRRKEHERKSERSADLKLVLSRVFEVLAVRGPRRVAKEYTTKLIRTTG
jgi:hypothetical protein